MIDVVYNHTAEGNEMGRPSPSAASTMRATTFSATTRAIISTRPAAETRLNLRNPRPSDGDGFACATGSRNAMSTASASTSPPRSAATATPSTRTRSSSMRCVRTRSCPRQADRRALGHRSGAISSATSPPAGRSGTTPTATRFAASGRATRAARRVSPASCSAIAAASTSDGRRPWASVNFVTAHDGFTLMDLVSYNDKHNEANGKTTATAIRTI
jgi:hypothetical protein